MTINNNLHQQIDLKLVLIRWLQFNTQCYTVKRSAFDPKIWTVHPRSTMALLIESSMHIQILQTQRHTEACMN